MKKLNEKKINTIKTVNEFSLNSISITIMEYANIPSLELKHFRKKLYNKNIKTKVIKNSLIRKALTDSKKILTPYLKGQILIIFNYTEVLSEPIKTINEFSLKNSNFKIKAIYAYDKIFINDGIKKIINLKSKELETYTLIQKLKTPIIKMVLTLKLIIKNKEGDQNDYTQ